VEFAGVVRSEAELRAVVGEPWELNLCKQISQLDHHCREFIARSPFVLVGTSDEAGRCDVSPRGDAPGFALVADDATLVLPERAGNRRADSLRNVLASPHVGLLFLIPGSDETLRINGRAQIIQDSDVLGRLAVMGTPPLLALAVEVEECFLHCGRAFKRARLWDAGDWPPASVLTPLAQILMDHAQPRDCTLEELQREIEEAYERLY